MASRRRSLLEDEDVRLTGKDESSSGDVCERCGHTREEHELEDVHGGSCVCGCEEFVEF